jgi:hypothetical protein
MRTSKYLSVVLSLLCYVGTQGFAFAALPSFKILYNLNDGFETYLDAQWGFVGTAYYYFGAGTANTGSYTAQLKSQSPGNWAAAGRYVNAPNTAPSCKTGVFVKSGSGRIDGNLEVIDPATWRYISVMPFTLLSSEAGTWIPVATANWRVEAGQPSVYVRVSIWYTDSEETAYVDDMKTTCWQGSSTRAFISSAKLTYSFGGPAN